MRITGWHIDGFGVFREYRLEQLPPGLTILLGANEAGKTTLLAYLRGVLFGFPGGQRGKNFYPPMNGGNHGGRVFLESPEGSVSVERFVGKRQPEIRGKGSMQQGPEDLRALLGGVDEALFRSVFAFSLTELQDLDTLSEDGVRDRIFSAGIRGAGSSANQALKELDKEMDSLLRPRKKEGPRINQLIHEMKLLEDTVRKVEIEAERYPEILERRRELESRLEEIRDEQDRVGVMKARSSLLRDLWPLEQELQEARGRLRELEKVEEFPANPEDRLAAVLESVRGAEKAKRDAQGRLDATKDRIVVLEEGLEERLLAVADGVDVRHGSLGIHRERVENQLPELRNREKAATAKLQEELRNLGPGWDEHKVAATDVSVPKQEALARWERKLNDAGEDAREAKRRFQEAAQAREERRDGRDRKIEDLKKSEEPDALALEDQEGALRTLRNRRLESERLQAQVERLEEQRRVAALRQAERRHAVVPAAVSWLLGILAALAAVGGISLLVSGYASGLALIVGLASVMVGLTLGGVVAYLRSRAQSASDHEGGQGVRGAEEQLGAANRQLGNAVSELKRAAESLGLNSLPEVGEIDDCETELSRLRGALDRYIALQQDCRDAEEGLLRAERNEGGRKQAWDNAQHQLQDMKERWAEERTLLGVSEDLSPQAASDFIRGVRGAGEALAEREKVRKALRQAETLVDEWESGVRELLKEAGRSAGGELKGDGSGSGEQLIQALVSLRAECEEDRGARVKLEGEQESWKQLQQEMNSANEELVEALGDREGLFREAGVEDEEGFRRRLVVYRERMELEKTSRDRERQIEARLGRGEEAELKRRELAAGRVEEWEKEEMEAGRATGDLEEEKEEVSTELGKVLTEQENLEESGDMPELRSRMEGMKADVAESFRRWQMLAAARGLIKETLAEFTKARQPGVLEEAGSLFARITEGRYREVIQSGEGEGLEIVDSDGRVKLPEQLSRGTAEQLYLCLRLALAADMGERMVPLPVVMDDVLVNFDPRRAEATAQVLTEFSAGHQLLFFTCHPATMELLRQTRPETNVVILEDGMPNTFLDQQS